MIVLDTSVAYALLDGRDRLHAAARDWYLRNRPSLITTPLIVAEIDHLAQTRCGAQAASAWRADLAAGAYLVDWWPQALTSSVEVAERYGDLALGLSDASLVALAARLDTVDIATFDERHFRAVRPLTAGDAFRLHPLDS